MSVPSACSVSPRYLSSYSGIHQRLCAQLLHPLHPKVVEGNSLLIQTKNTCPLCRERYQEIRYRNKVIPVAQPPTPHRPVRAPVLPTGHQRRIVYVPFFLYPQQHCLVYQTPSYYLLPPAVDESAGGYSLSLPTPSFFIPTL